MTVKKTTQKSKKPVQKKTQRKIPQTKTEEKVLSLWEDKETFLAAYPQTKEKYVRLELFSLLPDHRSRVIWLNRTFQLGLKQD